eukprot:TRINITY_DN23251_c0_g1_i1.p1 TRINITY_DN23251_c0_g1~~TRINITY_DN23251_c0_g1_i1.p1  ORF type:complete len:338 (+),score=53.76 TRINITY_DN23251_c0_g1_i1:48-1061(+)
MLQADAAEKQSKLAQLLIVLGALFFSLMGLCVKKADAKLSTFTMLAVRSALGLIFSLVASCLRAAYHGKAISANCIPKLTRRELLWLAVRSLVGFGSILLEYIALKQMPLGLNTVIVYSSPGFIVLWSALLVGERIRLPVVACLIVAFAGLVITIHPWETADVEAPVWAYATSILAAVGAGLVYVSLGQLKQISYEVVMYVFLSTCLVLSIVVGLLLGVLEVPPMGWSKLCYLLGVGVFAYAAEVCVTCGFARARGNLGRVSVLKFLTPIFSTAWDLIFLHGHLHMFGALGGCLILVSSAIIVLFTKSTVQEDESSAEEQCSASEETDVAIGNSRII